MLLIEKVLTLRSSEIFEFIPEADLVDLAGALTEIHIAPHIKLFSKGDVGNCMYFIYKGKIQIEDDGQTLTILTENEILGEMSVLDEGPRSADAITLEESILLKLEQEPFYEIILNNTEVLRGILRVLGKRLRLMDAKLAANKAAANVPESLKFK